MGKYIIGIDLGTTKSVVAIYEGDHPKIIENLGKRTTPSFVALKKTKNKQTGETASEWIVGESAKNQAIRNPLDTLYGVKRLIGRRFDDPEVTKMKELASYKIVKGPNGDAWVEVDGKAMSPSEISAKVLRALKEAAERYLGEEVTEAVITVPAYFNDAQRQATRDAGAIAGLDVKRIINEPTAAALAYGMDKKKSGNVLVYDLGGGTFDVSVLSVLADPELGYQVEVRATNGDTFLGGENFDERVMTYLADELKKETGLDLRAIKDLQALQRLKDAAEKAKIELSSQDTAEINLPFIGRDENGDAVNFEYTLTRARLEQLVQDLIDKTKGPCQKALADAGLKASDIDDIILVGAQTRMPKVVETVRALFGKEPRNDVSVQEIVAMGASVQAAIINGQVENALLLDVIPLSIGIRAKDDVMATVIPRNSSIPTSVSDVFSTAAANQTNVEIQVYQGERARASENKLLGKFTLEGIPPAPAGVPQIEVTFRIDADGTLDVSAKDQRTGRAQKITIKANGGLTEEEVARMLKDAEMHAEADRLFKEWQAASAQAADALKDAAGDETQEYFQTAPEDLKDAFRTTVRELTEAVAKKDLSVTQEKTQRLQEVRTRIGEAFYNASNPGGGASPAPDQPEAAEKDPPSAGPKP